MRDLLALTAELVAIPSPSHGEGAIADRIEALVGENGELEVVRIGDNLIARTNRGAPSRVILAGHLDTVPASGNTTPTSDGAVLRGLGSADMKSGLAVMVDLAQRPPPGGPDLTFVFYTAEEVARRESGLLVVDAARPDLLVGDVAIIGEPTGAVVEAGCQGVARVQVTLAGARAHTARPWMGRNAIHRLGPLLGAVGAWQPRCPVLDGCRYRESLQVVSIAGGGAANVVPDRAALVVNHRFAPDRSAEQAVGVLVELLGRDLEPDAGDAFEVVESAPAAAPGLSHPVLAALVAASGSPPRAKLGWTDVAFFAERGIPAVNFGPGDPELAHTAGEQVTRTDIDAVHRTLAALLTGA